MTLSPGIEGVIVQTEIFQRNERGRKSKEDKSKEQEAIKKIKAYYKQEIEFIEGEKEKRICKMLGISKLKLERLNADELPDESEARSMLEFYNDKITELIQEEEQEVERVKRGDELPAGVLKRVVVYVATKRKLQEGDILESYRVEKVAGKLV